jgi:hypothetical protein
MFNRTKKAGAFRSRSAPPRSKYSPDSSTDRNQPQYFARGNAIELSRINAAVRTINDPGAAVEIVRAAHAVLLDYERRGQFQLKPTKADFSRVCLLAGFRPRYVTAAWKSYQRNGSFSTIYAMAGGAGKPPVSTAARQALFDEGEVRKALAVLIPEGSVFEIRAVGAKLKGQRRKGTVSGYFDNHDSCIASLHNIASAVGIYITLNPVDPALLARRVNRLDYAEKNETTSDHNVRERRLLLLDFDFVRAAGISSTDAEKEKTHQKAIEVFDFLKAHDFGEAIAADSGNGYHLLYRTDLPCDDKPLKTFLAALAHRFNGDGVEIDSTVYNSSRIIRLYGTLAAKGEGIPDRPHRMSQILNPARSHALRPLINVQKVQAIIEELQPTTERAERDQQPRTQARKPDKAQVREMLAVIPKRPPYHEWVKIISAVGDALSASDAIEVLCEWSAEENEGEYAEKLKTPLDNVSVGTLFHLAEQYGWQRTEQRREKSIQTLLESELPKIRLPGDNRLLSDFALDLGEVLKGHGLYQRGGVAMIVNDEHDGLEVITPAMLRTLVERNLVCYRVIDGGEGRTAEFFKTMSTDNAQGVLSAKQFLSCLPKVDRIATTRLPIMRENGVIELLPDGYDAQSKTLTLSQCSYTTLLPLEQARGIIDDLFSEFPFADSGRSNAVAVAATVGLYASGLIDRKTLRPVFIYIGNAEGAGKTLLAICAITPTHGEAKIDSKLEDQTETKKELLAAVIEARPYVLFDNVKGHLNSPALEGFTTSTRFSGRILGVSRMFSGQNIMTVFITGNGCTVSPDMRRRSLFVELFMLEEHAEERVFERELDQKVVLDLRPKILASLWAFVREWDKAGRPNPSRTHNAFPEWSRIIGGIVEHAGYSCPFEIAEIDDAADLDGAHMHELAKLLSECEAESLTFDQLVSLSRDHGLFERIIGTEDAALKPAERSKLGKLLKRYDRRLFAQGHFVIDGKGRSRTYRVARIT